MARSGFPSMTALLGLLAVAGYQNRDRIREMLRNAQAGGRAVPGGFGGTPGGQQQADAGGHAGQFGGGTGGTGGMAGGGLPGGLGGLLGGLLGGGAAGGGLGSLLGGGLQELDGRFRQAGRGDVMESWVGHGPNRPLNAPDLEATLGPEVMADLQEATGLSRGEILDRLSRTLPQAVDGFTPEGRLPGRDELA